MKIEGLLPVWSGPSPCGKVIKKFRSSFRHICRDLGLDCPMNDKAPYPQWVLDSMEDLGHAIAAANPSCWSDLEVGADESKAGYIRYEMQLNIYRVMYIPIEQLTWLLESGERKDLSNLLLSTFCYLKNKCGFDMATAHSYHDAFFEYCVESTDVDALVEALVRMAKKAERGFELLNTVMKNNRWLEKWDEHLREFCPQNDAELDLMITCCELRSLYEHFPTHSISTDWYHDEQDEDNGEQVWPEPVFCFPTIIEEFGDDLKDNPEAPSCSTAEALLKQDLYVNTKVAVEAANQLWKLLSRRYCEKRGVVIDCENDMVVPIPL